jgi:flagellar protein FliJ
MKSRDTLLKLKRFHADEKKRRVTQIETMIAEFDRMIRDLDRDIETEQNRAGINDPAHYAYPTYARAAMVRRDNLIRSGNELRTQLDEAREELQEAFIELKKFELLEGRDAARDRASEANREQTELDAIGANLRASA